MGMRPRVNRARTLRRRMTDAEQKLWFHLRDRRFEGLKFRRQHPVGRFVADFCCVERKLVIELDGGQHLLETGKDRRRSEALGRLGYQVMRFWDDQALKDTEAVLEEIRRALQDRPPSP